jgi:hypothetical protein
MMVLVEKLIKHLFPNKIITYRLSELKDRLSLHDSTMKYIYISIEKDNNSRQFCYVTIDELKALYDHSTTNERSIYELITSENQVKAYIDFEYYVNNNLDIENSHTGVNCILKILYYLLNSEKDNIDETDNQINTILKEFLILEA